MTWKPKAFGVGLLAGPALLLRAGSRAEGEFRDLSRWPQPLRGVCSYGPTGQGGGPTPGFSRCLHIVQCLGRWGPGCHQTDCPSGPPGPGCSPTASSPPARQTGPRGGHTPLPRGHRRGSPHLHHRRICRGQGQRGWRRFSPLSIFETAFPAREFYPSPSPLATGCAACVYGDTIDAEGTKDCVWFLKFSTVSTVVHTHWATSLWEPGPHGDLVEDTLKNKLLLSSCLQYHLSCGFSTNSKLFSRTLDVQTSYFLPRSRKTLWSSQNKINFTLLEF